MNPINKRILLALTRAPWFWLGAVWLGAFLLWHWFVFGRWPSAIWVAFWFIISVCIVFLATTLTRGRVEHVTEGTSLFSPRKEYEATESALLTVLERIAGAENEEQLVNEALAFAASWSNAAGISFVPLDEWEQPLRSYVYGHWPPSVLEGWAEHLTAPQVRLACKQCQSFHTEDVSTCPLLPAGITEIMRVECLPLRRAGRTTAVVNLYFTGKTALTPERRFYLERLFSIVLLALDFHRLRARESAIGSQLLGDRLTRPDLDGVLKPFVWDLVSALGCEGAALFMPKDEATLLPLFFTVGDFPLADPEKETALYTSLLRQAKRSAADFNKPVAIPGVSGGRAYVLRSVEGKPLGLLILVGLQFIEDNHPIPIRLILEALSLLIEAEQSHQMQAYQAVMQERLRLAREIHDGLAQTLAFLKLNTAQMRGLLSQGNLGRLEEALKQQHQVLAEIYLETRQVMDNLRLRPQEDMNVWIRQVTENFAQSTGLEVRCSLPAKAPELPLEVQAQILRIVQEALNNVRKHAHASKVWVTLNAWHQDWVLEIGDDGVGFSPEDVPRFSQHGLRGMRERAELIGAEFQVISKPYQGTIIRLQVPSRIQESLI